MDTDSNAPSMPDSDLTQSMAHALFRLKRVMELMQGENDLHLREMTVLHRLMAEEEGGCVPPPMADLHHGLFITKPAMSQILGGLERKGFITREIDTADRRRIKVILTAEGRTVVQEIKRQVDGTIDQIIARFGEEDLHQLITLLERFADTAEAVKKQMP